MAEDINDARLSGANFYLVKPVSEADAIREFEAWRESCGDNIPSAKEDIAHMKLHGVSRGRVRKLRQQPGVKRRPTGKRRQP